MKKVFVVLSLVMALIFVLTACGTGENSTTNATSQATGESTQPASTAKAQEPPVDLKIAWASLGQTPADKALVEEALNKIIIPKINAKAEFLILNIGAASQQFNLMLSSGEKVDLMLSLPFTYQNMVAKGQVQEIGPLLDKYGQGIKDALGDFIKGSTVNGKIYGVRPISDFGGGAAIIVRNKTVADFGLDTSKVKSFADIGNLLKTIKDKDPSIYPLMNMPPSTLVSIDIDANVDSLQDYFGVLMDRGQSLKVVNLFETEKYAEDVKLLGEWYRKGYVMKDYSTGNKDMIKIFESKTGYIWMMQSKPGMDKKDPRGSDYDQMGIEYAKPLSKTSNITLFQWVVPNACKTPDKAVQMLNLMFTDPEVANLMINGIEGKHYVKKPDGTIGLPAGVEAANVGYRAEAFMMGNELITPVPEGSPLDLWEKTKEFNKNLEISKAMGFVYDPTNVKSEITALNNVYNQYKVPLEFGCTNPEKGLAELISKLKAAGIDKVIAEKQKQLDAWAAANGVK